MVYNSLHPIIFSSPPFTGLGSLEFAEGGGAVGIALSDGTRVSGKRIDGHVSVNVAR